MTREISHQKSFEKALYSIPGNFPPGKMPGIERYASTYVNTSQGEGDTTGPWNSGEEWERVDDLTAGPVHRRRQRHGPGQPGVQRRPDSGATDHAHPHSDTGINPTTGADLGAKQGAGRTKPVNGPH